MHQLARQSEARADAMLSVVAPYDGTEIAMLECNNQRQLDSWLASAFSLHNNRDAWLPVA